MAQFRTSRTFDAIFVVLLGVVLWQAYVHRVSLGDWVFFQSNSPAASTIRLATDAGLSAKGRQLLERGNPQMSSAATIDAVCGNHRLGCLDEKGVIYIVEDPGNPQQATVTAAHEMLHLAYRRLTAEQKAGLIAPLEAAISTHNSPNLTEELEGFADADARLDEAHSLLGTEYADLPKELEEHYAQFFTNRQIILDAAEASLR